MDLLVIASAFGIVFVGELPDKTAVASLVLGARYPPLRVLLGVWAAFAVHVVVACIAGGFVAKLPRTLVEVVTSVLFLIGAVLLFRSDPEKSADAGQEEAAGVSGSRTGLRVTAASFGVVLIAEFGDLTQILTATLAARYRDPVSVGIGALLALWTVAALAVTFGQTLLRVVPLRRVQQLASVVLLVLAGVTLAAALRP